MLMACKKAIKVQKNYKYLVATQLILRDETRTAPYGLAYLEENLVFYLYASLTSCEIERPFNFLKSKLALANNIRTETIFHHLFIRARSE